MKSDKLSTHKKKAWEAFSLYIRTRDSIKTTGGIDYCVCVTCPNQYPRIGVGCIQAGHFIDGRGNAILFDEEATHGQCYGCNVGRNGAHVEYFVWMEQNYGRETIDRLRVKRHEIVKYKAWDYDTIADKYKLMTKELLESVR